MLDLQLDLMILRAFSNLNKWLHGFCVTPLPSRNITALFDCPPEAQSVTRKLKNLSPMHRDFIFFFPASQKDTKNGISKLWYFLGWNIRHQPRTLPILGIAEENSHLNKASAAITAVLPPGKAVSWLVQNIPKRREFCL